MNLLIVFIKISKASKAKSQPTGNSLCVKNLPGIHSWLGVLHTKILTVFLLQFSRLFRFLSSRILQNNLLDLYLVEICWCNLSFFAKAAANPCRIDFHFSQFLKDHCMKLITDCGAETATQLLTSGGPNLEAIRSNAIFYEFS